jgi:peptidoglycan/xylan/chitin deacetylase (PgdA/CDA1 family)
MATSTNHLSRAARRRTALVVAPLAAALFSAGILSAGLVVSYNTQGTVAWVRPTGRPTVEAAFTRESWPGDTAHLRLFSTASRFTVQIFRAGTERPRILPRDVVRGTAVSAPRRVSAGVRAAAWGAGAAGATFGASPVESQIERLHLPTPLPKHHVVVPILMYHRINVSDPSEPAVSRRLTVQPADFARQMAWLKRRGYRTVTQRELFAALVQGRPLGPRPILITFDDGYRDVFFKASPVLSRLGLHATAYVISGRISAGDSSFLTWPLLQALERRGVEIGSHTVRHRDLTSLSTPEALAELVNSRQTLERALGHPVQWLAYPFGRYDARVEELARRAGYVLATTTRAGVRQSASAPLSLRRLRVLDSTGVGGLAQLLASAGR